MLAYTFKKFIKIYIFKLLFSLPYICHANEQGFFLPHPKYNVITLWHLDILLIVSDAIWINLDLALKIRNNAQR
jgi:hypothetical protein